MSLQLTLEGEGVNVCVTSQHPPRSVKSCKGQQVLTHHIHTYHIKTLTLETLTVPLQLTLEGEGVNLRVTSPAATLALTMMYLRSGNASVAARFVIPATGFALTLVHPHLLLLRVLGRALVMWDSLQPTETWIQAQLPPLLQVGVGRLKHQHSPQKPQTLKKLLFHSRPRMEALSSQRLAAISTTKNNTSVHGCRHKHEVSHAAGTTPCRSDFLRLSSVTVCHDKTGGSREVFGLQRGFVRIINDSTPPPLGLSNPGSEYGSWFLKQISGSP